MLGPSIFVKWQMTFGLLKDHVTCKSCNRACNLQKKSDRINGMIWCCTSCASKPTQSVRNCSFFSNSHLHLEVILIFIYTYMTGLSFKYCSTVSGMHYKNTALDCGNFVRDIMVEFVYRIVMKTKFSGIVEIAESLFNRKIKYHRGRVWVFGLVERQTNRIKLFPVDTRDEETLTTILRQCRRRINHLF